MKAPFETPEMMTEIELYVPDLPPTYSIEMTAHLAQVSRHLIAVYCKEGLVSPLLDPDTEGWLFDDEAISRLRRIEELRTTWELNSRSLKLVVNLIGEVERLREEVKFLKGR